MVKIFVLLTIYALVSSSYCTFHFHSQALHLSANIGDSQQDVKRRAVYDHWTQEESRALLDIMVDATNRGWRNNGTGTDLLSNTRPPLLNSKLECNKNFKNYQSRLKWFRKRWLSYSTLLEFNSGFGLDSTTKRFTATNELWDKFLKNHPNNGNLRNEVLDDYEDLKIVMKNGRGAKKYSIRRGGADASTLKVVKGRDLAGLDYDADSEGDQERTYTTWDTIKEVPNLDAGMHINVFNLLDTETKKDGFFRMTPEEREKWITNKTRK
ncbi:hypothetical protein POM88_034635 [Heracleum sosnowskyi]|uniref:Myb-like domain-containing protein n=1 Tax=Heracleum sosnowskyi TaxID=360622 RepID=A0AAD8HKP7_9APIA|nr:hypothetical protein POM88_034635 [Heracleum sosnowskyi]